MLLDDPARPRYAAVDFGIVGSLDPRDQHYLAENFLAVFDRDYRRVAQLHLDSGWVPPGTRVDEMESAVRTVCEPIFDRPLKDISFGRILLRLFEISRRFNMQIQPQLILLQKTLLNMEGLGRDLYPDLDIWNTASPILREWMRERTSVRALVRSLRAEAPELLAGLRELPRRCSGCCARRVVPAAAPGATELDLLRAELRDARAGARASRSARSCSCGACARRCTRGTAGRPGRCSLPAPRSSCYAVSGAEANVARTLTQGRSRVVLFRFSLPILFANILQSLNGSVNSIWVGRYLGEAALTATSNANTVMFLLIGAAFGVALAATILIGQNVGANNLRETKRVVGTSATFFAAISVAMAATGLLCCRPLLLAMQTPPESLELAVAYMRVIFLALPFLYMYAFVMAVLRGAGDSKTPFSLHAALGRHRHRPQPGVHLRLGADSAPGDRRLGARHLRRAGGEPHGPHPPPVPPQAHAVPAPDELAYLRVDWTVVGTLVKKGIPMSAQMLVMSLSAVLMITLVNRFGTDTTAAFGAAMQIWNYIQMPAFAVGMGSLGDDARRTSAPASGSG